MSFVADSETISKWIKKGIEKGATHCLVICDTWDLESGFEDFPLYIMPGEDVNEISKKYSYPRGIEFLKNIYDLSKDIEEQ